MLEYTSYENRTPSEQYKDLIRDILDKGVWSESPMVDSEGNEIRTIDYMGAVVRFDILKDGVPFITERYFRFLEVCSW